MKNYTNKNLFFEPNNKKRTQISHQQTDIKYKEITYPKNIIKLSQILKKHKKGQIGVPGPTDPLGHTTRLLSSLPAANTVSKKAKLHYLTSDFTKIIQDSKRLQTQKKHQIIKKSSSGHQNRLKIIKNAALRNKEVKFFNKKDQKNKLIKMLSKQKREAAKARNDIEQLTIQKLRCFDEYFKSKALYTDFSQKGLDPSTIEMYVPKNKRYTIWRRNVRKGTNTNPGLLRNQIFKYYKDEVIRRVKLGDSGAERLARSVELPEKGGLEADEARRWLSKSMERRLPGKGGSGSGKLPGMKQARILMDRILAGTGEPSRGVDGEDEGSRRHKSARYDPGTNNQIRANESGSRQRRRDPGTRTVFIKEPEQLDLILEPNSPKSAKMTKTLHAGSNSFKREHKGAERGAGKGVKLPQIHRASVSYEKSKKGYSSQKGAFHARRRKNGIQRSKRNSVATSKHNPNSSYVIDELPDETQGVFGNFSTRRTTGVTASIVGRKPSKMRNGGRGKVKKASKSYNGKGGKLQIRLNRNSILTQRSLFEDSRLKEIYESSSSDSEEGESIDKEPQNDPKSPKPENSKNLKKGEKSKKKGNKAKKKPKKKQGRREFYECVLHSHPPTYYMKDLEEKYYKDSYIHKAMPFQNHLNQCYKEARTLKRFKLKEFPLKNFVNIPNRKAKNFVILSGFEGFKHLSELIDATCYLYILLLQIFSALSSKI